MYKLSKADREFFQKVRGVYPPVPSWYAIMTHFGKEHAVRNCIWKDFNEHGVEEIFLPEISHDRENPDHARQKGSCRKGSLLFGSHVFLHCRMSDEIYTRVIEYRGVMKILGRAYRIPSIIDDKEMQLFQAVLNASPAPEMMSRCYVGAQAQVLTGLMQGIRGRVTEIHSGFVKIQADFSFIEQGRAITVTVPREHVHIEEPRGECSKAGRLLYAHD
jgi:transcription antitermination factor NusG